MLTLLLASQVTALNDPGAWIWSPWAKQEEEGDASSLPGSIEGLGQEVDDTHSQQLDLPSGCTPLFLDSETLRRCCCPLRILQYLLTSPDLWQFLPFSLLSNV